MPFVLDASMAIAWCFEDDASPYADRVLERLGEDSALVPAVWPLEVANALCLAERRHRLQAADVARFVRLVGALPIAVESTSFAQATGPVLEVTRAHGLSACDASYLAVAAREGLSLATQDMRLAQAATRLGILLV